MKHPREFLSEIAEKLDLPGSAAANLSTVFADGFHSVSVEGQRGLLSYSAEEIAVAVPLGQVVIEGESLSITLMKSARIIVSGGIRGIRFVREGRDV